MRTHLSLSYSYSQSGNNNGEIASITDNQQSGRTVSYTYDSLHRVKTAVTNGSTPYPQWGLSWSYDRYGNRTGQSVTHGSGPSSSPTISTSTNRITALGGSSYYYDDNGNLTQDDLFKYKYDGENRVVEIRNLSDTLLSSYAYDGHSMQVIKVAGGTRTWFLYAGSQLVSEFEDASSNNYSSPTSPGSAPADTASTLLYQHSDHLTTRVTTDNAGTLSNQQGHYPFGELWYSNGTADPSVQRKFTSYRRETDSALASGQINYAVARYHGARVGRFHRPDPIRGRISNPQRLNRYAYVTNNPIRYTDPNGRDMSDGIGAEWECPNGPGTCIIPMGGGLMENPNAGGGGNMGYNIFDAIGGAAGTYLAFDSQGNLTWGFNYDLYVETMNYIDDTRDDFAGNDIDGDFVPMTGYTTYVTNYGWTSTTTGVIADWAASNGEAQWLASTLPADKQQAYQALVAAGANPAAAAGAVFGTMLGSPNYTSYIDTWGGYWGSFATAAESANNNLFEVVTRNVPR